MNKINKRKIRPFHVTYLISLALMILLILCINVTRTSDHNDNTRKSYKNITNQWKLTPGGCEELDFRNLGKYCDKDARTLNLYYQIPELEHDTTLIYRSKDVYTSLFIDEEKIYETSVPDSRFYNKSPGNLWNEVMLDKSWSGSILTLKIDIVYDTNAVTVDSFFLGDGTNIIRHFVNEKLFDILISILMILIGIMLILVNLISQNKNIYMGHGLLYLGIYSLLIGIWCLLETNVIQFFVSDQRILQLYNNMIMITAMLSLFLYLDYTYEVLKRPITFVICLLNLIYIYVCIFAQYTGLSDMHNLLLGSQISLLVCSALFLCWIIYACIKCKKEKQNLLPVILQMSGIGCLIFFEIFEFMKFTQGDFEDRAGSLRIGSLFFIILFGASSQIQTNKLIAKGLKYNVVKELAYSDGLTSVGNRTAYLEKLDSYISSDIMQLGIVYLDINNLKYVNDNFVHELGDELIIKASNIIQNSYGLYGKCYRIGGDEFCVLLESSSAEALYDSATNVFVSLIKQTNMENEFPFKINIAHGFSVCTTMTNCAIQQAVENADSKMYENKKILKKSM